MKKYISVIILVVAANAAFAIFINKFKSWDDLIDQSPVIFIAQCTSALGSTYPDKPIGITDGMIPSDVQIMYVLKGNDKTGPAQMASQYWPYQGERFLVFANYKKDEFNKGYTAIEGYRVISLGHTFNHLVWDRFLAGKPLKEQIQWIINRRLKDLNDEIAQDNDEKGRLEEFSKEK